MPAPVQTSTPIVTVAGNIVTYRVVVSNQGNVVLTNVSVISNVAPGLTYNQSALDDGLSVGEEVVMQSNITFNNTMIRAGNMKLSTNATAKSVTANVSSTSFATIVPQRCVSNNTVRKYAVLLQVAHACEPHS